MLKIIPRFIHPQRFPTIAFFLHKPTCISFHTHSPLFQNNTLTPLQSFHQTPTREFILNVAASLQKSHNQLLPLIELLEQNWYNTVSDLLTLQDEDAKNLNLPYRLYQAMKNKLHQEQSRIEQEMMVVEKTDSDEKNITIEKKSSSQVIKITKRDIYNENYKYGLSESEISPELRNELDKFYEFCTIDFFKQQEPPIGAVTAKQYVKQILLMLGWLLRHSRYSKELKAEQLKLNLIFPDSSRESAAIVFDYLQWLVRERKSAAHYQINVCKAAIKLAKFLFHHESKADVTSGDKPYQDILLLKELRKFHKDAAKKAKISSPVADESLKWLDWPEFLAICEELKKECTERTEKGRKRSPKAVAWSFQKYLIFSIFSCIPDRQRTLRELQVGKTLVKKEGKWYIMHGPDDYKTGKSYGARPPLLIAEHIYPYLEEYLEKWRPKLNPKHNFVFSQKDGGAPSSPDFIYGIFRKTTYKLTGKLTNPHLVRDMIVTYLRNTDASERQLESLAIFMGHSLKMQKESYDHRTKEQKVAPAIELIRSIPVGSLKRS